MARNCCHVSLAFVLKFLNFLQAFVGIAIILYSAWVLDQWNHGAPISPPEAPSPESSSLYLFSAAEKDRVSSSLVDSISGYYDGLGFELRSLKLPAPWFIYSFMGVGVLLCCISFIGCIAAEAINGCCLCFYTLLKTILILMEAALVAFIAIDRRWEKDLPLDPTGELSSLRSFIEKNVEIFKWVGITVVSIQALSLLLAIIIRATISSRSADDDEDDYEARGRTREPFLNPQSSQASGSNKGPHSDIWSARMRDKYGLSSGDKHGSPSQNGSRA